MMLVVVAYFKEADLAGVYDSFNEQVVGEVGEHHGLSGSAILTVAGLFAA
jgi:hypothetical protein